MRYDKATSPTQLPVTIMEVITRAHQHKQVLVLVTGVFDILHQEHITFLKKAKAVGDVLVVGLESDIRVKELKGPTRPINNEETRCTALESLKIADGVFVLPDIFKYHEDYVNIIRTIRPEYLAVSSNTPFIDRKQAIMGMVGGEVKIVHDYNPAISTTQILERQLQSMKQSS